MENRRLIFFFSHDYKLHVLTLTYWKIAFVYRVAINQHVCCIGIPTSTCFGVQISTTNSFVEIIRFRKVATFAAPDRN